MGLVRACSAAAAALAALAAPALAGGSLQARLGRALAVPNVSARYSAAVVLDLSTGQTVYARNASLALLPASNEKLAITYAALTALGPSFRIETDVLGEGSQTGNLWTGNVVLKGYGDPSLSTEDLAQLAQQVRRDGITRIDGRVLGDATWFDSRQVSPGWKSSFYILESPPLSALTVDRSSSRNPPLAAAQLFTKALRRAGVRVRFGAQLGAADDAAVPLASVDSPTVASLVHFMDIYSDNFTAEMLCKELGAVQVGAGTTAAGVGYITGQLAQAGVPLDGVRLVDGSGLSLLDRFTANALASLLTVMWHDTETRLELLSSLPTAGRTGTLHDRMRHTAAAGVVQAKTGTTDNASALSGFVGDRYVFAILQNGWPVDWYWARMAQDRFAAALAASP